MIAYTALLGAIVTEVLATTSLRLAVGGSKWWNAGAAVGYVVSFALLAITLTKGVPLGVAYGIWAASGVALTALVGRFLFQEPFTRVMAVGIVLIAGGVFLIEVGSHH